MTDVEPPVPGNVRLPAHVVFRELPFCGVLFDARRARVYRLSQQQTVLLRQALSRPAAPCRATGAVPPETPPDRRVAAGRLLDELGALGLVRPGGGPAATGGDAG